MSAIYFHSLKSTAAVSGRERGLMGNYCSEALLFALGNLASFRSGEPSWIMKFIPKDCYLHELDYGNESNIKVWLNVGNGSLILPDGPMTMFQLQLNSACALGGNPFKLAARLHGQCEIHCYVEGQNRAWLAGMIDEALAKNIFRAGMGWDKVCELLRSADDSPVVCSYSVCESFPNEGVSEWERPAGEENEDAWYDLSEAEQWELAMAGLRKNDGGLELDPDEWDDFYFGRAPLSGFDVREMQSGPTSDQILS
jgi:hypothetical protein